MIQILRLLSAALVLGLPLAMAQTADQRKAYEHGYYLEHAKRDHAGASAAYRKALTGGGPAAWQLRCRTRLASCLIELGKLDEARKVLAALGGPASADGTRSMPQAPGLPKGAIALWSLALGQPLVRLVAGERHLAIETHDGRLLIVDAVGGARFRSPKQGGKLRPLAWLGGTLLVQGERLLGLVNPLRGGWERVWQIDAGEVAGAWRASDGAICIARRDGSVWRSRGAATELGACERVLPIAGAAVKPGIAVLRDRGLERWGPDGKLVWRQQLPAGRWRLAVAADQLLVCSGAEARVYDGDGKLTSSVKLAAQRGVWLSRGRALLLGADRAWLLATGEAPRELGSFGASVTFFAGNLVDAVEGDLVGYRLPGVTEVLDPATQPWELELARRMAKRVKLSFDNDPLATALAELTRQTGVDFVIHPRLREALDADGDKVMLQINDAAAEAALDLICGVKQLRAVVCCGVVVIERRGPSALPTRLPEALRKREDLAARLSLNLGGTPLGDAVRFVDERVTVAEGLRDARTTLRLNRLTKGQILMLLASLHGGELRVEGEGLTIQRRKAAVARLFALRGAKLEQLQKLGADEATQGATRRALRWLAKQQADHGGWDAAKHGAKLGWVDTGVTALATLAFLGAGQTDRVGEHKRTVGRALARLESLIGEDGLVGPKRGHYLYHHAIATMALAEAAALTGQDRWRQAARRAGAYLLKARNEGMAWRYGFRDGDNDVSVTSWSLQALAALSEAGIELPGHGKAVREAVAFIDAMTDPTYGITGYKSRPPRGWQGPTSSRFINDELGVNTAASHVPNHTPTAMAVASRALLATHARAHPAQQRAGKALARMLPQWKAGPQSTVDYVYWLFGSQAAFQLSGKTWQAWNQALKPTLTGNQADDGSWPATGAWSFATGKVGSTALATLTLEVYGRHLRRR